MAPEDSETPEGARGQTATVPLAAAGRLTPGAGANYAASKYQKYNDNICSIFRRLPGAQSTRCADRRPANYPKVRRLRHPFPASSAPASVHAGVKTFENRGEMAGHTRLRLRTPTYPHGTWALAARSTGDPPHHHRSPSPGPKRRKRRPPTHRHRDGLATSAPHCPSERTPRLSS